MKAVVIGPGRAGCGFVAPTLRACNYDVTFVGRDPAVVENLDTLRRYRIKLLRGRWQKDLSVDGVRAVRSLDLDRAARAIAGADLVATAVGARELANIAPLVAEGLRRRDRPVNVLCCENLADAGPRLRALVAEHLAPENGLARHGFAGALVMRAITHRVGDPRQDAPLTFIGDLPCAFIVERDGLVAPLPRLDGMLLTSDYTVAVRAKLYIFSAGHATAAYLGYLKGHRFVHTAMGDPEIHPRVLGAMAEGRHGIATRYGERFAGQPGSLPAIATRLENPELRDPVSRVGRDPLRKLARDDRLVGAAQLALAAGIAPVNLCIAAAAALRFANPTDASARMLRAQLEQHGVRRTLAWVTGLDEDDPTVRRIVAAWQGVPVRAGSPSRHKVRSS